MACCNEFTRAALIRQGIARAGSGLPRVEPGMPLPAGSGMARRTFLMRSSGLALSVYGASLLTPRHFLDGIAEAAAATPANPVLVSIYMQGGWDALSVLAPVGDPNYTRLRPTLSLEEGTGVTFSEDPTLMWHPSAASLATLHSEGKVTTFPAIGYDPPDESHFTSRHYWEVGELDASVATGWLGRYIDLVGSKTNPLQGLALDDSLAPALATATNPVATVSSPADYGFWANGIDDPVLSLALETLGELGALPADSTALAQARGAAVNMIEIRGEVAPFVTSDGQPNYNSAVTYPTSAPEFDDRLAALAAMLAAGLPISVAALEAPGSYDTHSDEGASLSTNLQQTMDGVLAFQRDLEARGIADRVLIQLWSEFGRRPQDNGSGTDHGAAGVAFLVGTRASGVMVGEFPGLADLDVNDNLVNTSDYRAMYCSLLEQWFQTEAGLVIPDAASFARPALLKS
jgi:uncharacterized protein (DUF1501 family)